MPAVAGRTGGAAPGKTTGVGAGSGPVPEEDSDNSFVDLNRTVLQS